MAKQRNKDYVRDYTLLTYAFSWVFIAFLFFRLSGGDWGFWLFWSGCSLLFSFFFLWAPTCNILVSNAIKVIKIVSGVTLLFSLVLFVAEYVDLAKYIGLLGGESTEIIANQSWHLPIAIVGILWVLSFAASLVIQVKHPIAKAQARIGKRSKREVWLKSLAFVAAFFGFLCIILIYLPFVNINYVITILAAGLILLSLGIFLEVSCSGENIVSNINQDARNVADEFARWAADQYHYFKEFLNLYDFSEKRRELLEETAKGFFSDLFWMYIDHIIQNVSNLTDPPETGKNPNFSIRSVHNYFKGCPRYYAEDVEILVKNIEAKAKKVRTWRNKLGAHYDWHVAIGDKNVSDRFVRGDFEVLYDNLQKYVDLLFSSTVSPIDTVSYYGTSELVRALQEAHALRGLKKRDINAYHSLMSNSTFKDA